MHHQPQHRVLLLSLLALCAIALCGMTEIRIPPPRSSAVRVQAAGAVVSTGTGTGTSWQQDLQALRLSGYRPSDYSYNAGSDAIWTDKMGKYNASQSVDAQKPILVGDYLQMSTATQARWLQNGLIATDDVVYAIKFSLDEYTPESTMFLDGVNSGGRVLFGVLESSGYKYCAFRASLAQWPSSTAPSTNIVHAALWTHRSTTDGDAKLYVNGSSQGAASGYTNIQSLNAGMIIGRANFDSIVYAMRGRIYGVDIYNTALTDAQLASASLPAYWDY